MITILKKMFKANPGKSSIQIKDKCSDCGCEVIIDITPISSGFGLQGGAMYKCAPDAYRVQCPECYKSKSKSKSKIPKVTSSSHDTGESKVLKTLPHYSWIKPIKNKVEL